MKEVAKFRPLNNRNGPRENASLREGGGPLAVEGACVTNSIAETIVKQGFFANRPHQNSAQLHYDAGSFHRKRSPFLPEEGIVLTASEVGCGEVCLNPSNSDLAVSLSLHCLKANLFFQTYLQIRLNIV